MVISSPILANGANVVTKSGQGLVILSGAGAWTGMTYVNGGTLQVQARSGDVPYVVSQGATLRIGYSSGSGYANTNMKIYGSGTASTAGVYFAGGTQYSDQGEFQLLNAPTVIHAYGSGIVQLYQFDINLVGLDCTSAASGSCRSQHPDMGQWVRRDSSG